MLYFGTLHRGNVLIISSLCLYAKVIQDAFKIERLDFSATSIQRQSRKRNGFILINVKEYEYIYYLYLLPTFLRGMNEFSYLRNVIHTLLNLEDMFWILPICIGNI